MSHDKVYNTNNYVWCLRDRVGYGATGAVYVGYNKVSGDRVAIKVFTAGSEFKSLKREVDVVQSLPPHDNIVTLYGVEEERQHHNKVIIMELCTGGSLYEVIDSPENSYGLCETEFKQVIYDVANGLQHLRQHNFIHRDIKPGNIMRCQKSDGSYVFKLADFGTARELGPEDTFVSLHGTEEYLYPGMYERALVNPSKRNAFSAQVDLWSVGATFFHAATGRLPFQPYRKRDDRALMFQIISQKKTGVISGWQLDPNGKIIYSEQLPSDTQLSLGLKLLIHKVLAGLMENDIHKMMSFDDFFRAIEKIHRKRVIDVFCVHSCTCHKVYIDPEERDGVERLKHLIHMQTGLEPQFQELFFENLPYKPVEPTAAAKLPITTVERPVFVFGGPLKKTAELESRILPTPPSIPQGFALANDVHFAKECAKVMYYLRFVTEQIDRMHKLMHQAALCFGYTVRHEYSILEQRMASAEQLNQATCRVLKSQVAGLKSIRDTLVVINNICDGKFADEIHQIAREIRAKQDLSMTIKDSPAVIQDKAKRMLSDLDFIDSWDPKYCADIFHRSIDSFQFQVRSVDSSYKTFLKERKYKTMSAHDQKVHEFTKLKLQSKLTEAEDKVVALRTGRDMVYTKLWEWFVRMIPLRYDVSDIDKKITVQSEQCSIRLQELDYWEQNEYAKQLQFIQQKILVVMSEVAQSPSPPRPPPASQVQLPRNLLVRLEESSNALAREVAEQRDRLEIIRVSMVNGNSPQGLKSRSAT